MGKKKNVKKNYIYNLVYQIFTLITPLITTPYISRVLGSSGVGQYSFTYSIATYFMIFGAFGFSIYAEREIARHQGDKEEQSKIFYEIMIARFMTVGFATAIFISVILTGVYGITYTTLMWILTISVVSTAFDVTFLFQGNEDFGIIALRNIIIKALGVAAILIFVKNETHVWLYALCQAIILIVSNISLWTRLPKYLTKVKIKDLRIKRHFLPTLRLFIPTIAVSVYTVLDKTLIGVMVPGTVEVDGVEKNVADIENGFYDQAEKMVKMAMTVITSLGVVMIPRNSNAISTGNIEEFKNNINSALRFVFFLGTPIMFGLAAVASNFSPWFFGPGYEKVPYLMMMLSPLVLIIGLSNVLGIQYLLPLKQDKGYTIAITGGAILNLALNIVLIYFLWSYGAVISTIAAEIFVTGLMLFFARKDIKVLNIIKLSWKYIIAGILMFAAVFLTQYYLLSPSIWHTIILILEGMFVYFVFLLIVRDEFLLSKIKKVFGKIKLILNRKKQNKNAGENVGEEETSTTPEEKDEETKSDSEGEKGIDNSED